MITKETLVKVCSNIKNNQMLNIISNYLINNADDDVISTFIEMCLCDDNEIELFIKTKDDFNKMKIIGVIDKLEDNRCITDILDIVYIDWIKHTIIVKYRYYDVTYHGNLNCSDVGVQTIDDYHKYSKIHTDNSHVSIIRVDYKHNDVLV